MSEDLGVAAILSTDIVGFWTLMQRDEERANAVRDRQVRLLKQFDGEGVQADGDEALAVFADPQRAVDCALALQSALREAGGDLRLRVGIHLGEVQKQDGRVSGEGVEVAERICRSAEPGGIVASGVLWERVKQQSYLVGRKMEPGDTAGDQPTELFALGLRA